MAHSLPTGSYSFFVQLYVIVNDRSLDSIISWSGNNDYSFVVWDVDELCRRILPKYEEFGRNFSEFVSELRHQRFRRFGQFVFGHKNFVRGRPELLRTMIPSNKKFEEKLKAKRDKAKAKRARAKVVRLLENLQI